jgi:hypothetical protein
MPTEFPTEFPSEDSTSMPTEFPTESPGEDSTSMPTEFPTESPIEVTIPKKGRKPKGGKKGTMSLGNDQSLNQFIMISLLSFTMYDLSYKSD